MQNIHALFKCYGNGEYFAIGVVLRLREVVRLIGRRNYSGLVRLVFLSSESHYPFLSRKSTSLILIMGTIKLGIL